MVNKRLYKKENKFLIFNKILNIMTEKEKRNTADSHFDFWNKNKIGNSIQKIQGYSFKTFVECADVHYRILFDNKPEDSWNFKKFDFGNNFWKKECSSLHNFSVDKHYFNDFDNAVSGNIYIDSLKKEVGCSHREIFIIFLKEIFWLHKQVQMQSSGSNKVRNKKNLGPKLVGVRDWLKVVIWSQISESAWSSLNFSKVNIIDKVINKILLSKSEKEEVSQLDVWEIEKKSEEGIVKEKFEEDVVGEKIDEKMVAGEKIEKDKFTEKIKKENIKEKEVIRENVYEEKVEEKRFIQKSTLGEEIIEEKIIEEKIIERRIMEEKIVEEKRIKRKIIERIVKKEIIKAIEGNNVEKEEIKEKKWLYNKNLKVDKQKDINKSEWYYVIKVPQEDFVRKPIKNEEKSKKYLEKWKNGKELAVLHMPNKR